MKIGIFGDSFGDVNLFNGHPWPNNYAWAKQIEQAWKPESIEFHSKCGASTWYSYQHFLKHYQKFDHIVFVYTYHYRWPHLHEDLGMRHWNVNAVPNFIHDYKENESWADEEIRNLCKSYDLLFSPELLTFINKSVVRDINMRCQRENIKLVNIFVTDSNYGDHNGGFRDNYNEEDLLFSSIENLHWVSARELVKLNGKEYTINQLVEKFGLPDARFCHMWEHNNTVVANLVKELFYKKQTVIAQNLSDWSLYDPRADAYYQSRMS